jgi:Flp pilus assembly protein TadG
MIRRFFTRLRNRDGWALILAAILFPLVLLFLAFVVDVAHAFVDTKDAFPRNRTRLRVAT